MSSAKAEGFRFAPPGKIDNDMITRDDIFDYLRLLKKLDEEEAFISLFNEMGDGCVFPSSHFRSVNFSQKVEKDINRLIYFLNQTFSNGKKIDSINLFTYGEQLLRIRVSINSHEELDEFIRNFLNKKVVEKIVREI